MKPISTFDDAQLDVAIDVLYALICYGDDVGSRAEIATVIGTLEDLRFQIVREKATKEYL